ncbi:MAG: DMT family transporter [Candidatus Kapabacteria bacterium]|nr:DMT family transporter [Candidatus Kapabacteria bacterium]
MKRHNAEFLLFVITILWAGTFAIVKTAVVDVNPSVFVLLRFAIATVVALALWPKSVRSFDRDTMSKGLMLGTLYGVGFLLQTIGLTLTSASASAFITGTMVVFVPIVNRVVSGSRIQANHGFSIILVLVGLYLFTSPDTLGINLGDVLTLMSAICWAVYLTYIDVWTTSMREDVHRQNALVVLQFVATMVIAGVGVGYSSMGGASLLFTLDSDLVLGLLYCGIFASVIPTFVQTRYQQYTHPVRAGVIYAIEPLAASAIAWLVINEQFTTRQLFGGAVLMTAIVLPDVLASMRKK